MDEAALRELVTREFSALEGVVYLDHAMRGPLPQRAVEAMHRATVMCARGALAREELGRFAEEARANVAHLVGAEPGEVAFVQNATAATATIAQGIRWKEGDRVVTNAGEYASNILPWRALEERGVTVEVVPLREGRLEVEDVARAMPGARVLTVSAVSIKTGERRDLGALGKLAREHGALLCVDLAQAAGVLALDLRGLGVDFAVGSSRKSLLGPPEVGILYVRRERLEELKVTAGGAGSRVEFHAPPLDRTWKPDARRFEGGALAGPLLAGLAASTSLLLEVGMGEVERRALESAVACLDRWYCERLSPAPGTPGFSPIVRVATALRWTEESLRARGIVARVEPDSVVRMSPHFWTDLARS